MVRGRGGAACARRRPPCSGVPGGADSVSGFPRPLRRFRAGPVAGAGDGNTVSMPDRREAKRPTGHVNGSSSEMNAMTDVRLYDHRALDITEKIVEQVEPAHLTLPTPCAHWSLRKLLAHMTGQNHGFAAAADGETTDATAWADRDPGSDPARTFRASATRVRAAFAREGVLDGEFWLPEVRGGQMFPAHTAIGFHFVDYVVHGWDVAATLGVAAPFDQEILEAVLPYAQEVPDGPNRRVPGASFGPGLPPRGDQPLDRVLAMLGRRADWAA